MMGVDEERAFHRSQDGVNLRVEGRISSIEADLRWMKWLLVAITTTSALNVIGFHILDSVTLWHP